MPFKQGAALAKRAREQNREDRLFMQWCAWLPYMNDDRPQSFELYVDQCTGRAVDTRPTEEILKDLGITLDEEVSNGT